MFSHHNAPTYTQKKREDLAEKILDIEQRKERDPTLNFGKHLQQVKEEIKQERQEKKEIERTFGKEPDAPLKYAAAVESEKRRRKADQWASD